MCRVQPTSADHYPSCGPGKAEKGVCVGTTTGQHGHTETRLTLFADHVVEADERSGTAVTGCEFGVFRATKNTELIEECLELINRGGVAALVPVTASDEYLEGIANQVEYFARSRTVSTDSGSEGILALPTSGSTGAPKVVAIPTSGVSSFLHWGQQFFSMDAQTVSLSLSPWNFDVSLLDTWAVLAAGGTVVAADASKLHDASYLSRLLAEHHPTFVQVVPATLDMLITAAGHDTYKSVGHVVMTGGVASQANRRAASRLFPKATFYNIYGATEVNDCLVESLTAEEFSETETLPLGSPIGGCDVVLHEGGNATAVEGNTAEAEGELLVRTPWMALGYISEGALHPLPSTEAEAFGELYPMKDRAKWSGGRLMYLGRGDRTIKLRGQRVNLDEIENTARQTALAGMACAWVDHSTQTDELHLAYTAPSYDSLPVSGLHLRIQMSRRLPAYAMPNHLHPFDQPFPLNGNGKPDLYAIKTLVERE